MFLNQQINRRSNLKYLDWKSWQNLVESFAVGTFRSGKNHPAMAGIGFEVPSTRKEHSRTWPFVAVVVVAVVVVVAKAASHQQPAIQLKIVT